MEARLRSAWKSSLQAFLNRTHRTSKTNTLLSQAEARGQGQPQRREARKIGKANPRSWIRPHPLTPPTGSPIGIRAPIPVHGLAMRNSFANVSADATRSKLHLMSLVHNTCTCGSPMLSPGEKCPFCQDFVRQGRSPWLGKFMSDNRPWDKVGRACTCNDIFHEPGRTCHYCFKKSQPPPPDMYTRLGQTMTPRMCCSYCWNEAENGREPFLGAHPGRCILRFASFGPATKALIDLKESAKTKHMLLPTDKLLDQFCICRPF